MDEDDRGLSGCEPALAPLAPQAHRVTEYDRRHFAIYAQLVSAHDSGKDWRVAALDILGLDVPGDEVAARRCYRSHRDRALWIATVGYRMLIEEAEAALRE